jgi:tartrate/fumarate subfamily iron-sulfur-dependent hydro-lyase alpha chain
LVSYEAIKNASALAYTRNVQVIPEDVINALEAAIKIEENPEAIWALEHMVAAARAAPKENMTMCEDTGQPAYDVFIGTEMGDIPENIEDAINEGYDKCFTDMGLRPRKLTHPIDRTDAGPAIVQYHAIPGKDYMEIVATPKGGGTEPKSSSKTFDPITPAIFKKWVVDYMAEVGGKACAPNVIGLGIGGDVAIAGNLALEATFRKIGDWHPNPKVAEWEQELTAACNELGIGPMGMGGKTTVLAVFIEVSPSSRRWSSVSFNLKCWPNRSGVIRVYKDNTFEPVDYERKIGMA